MTGTGEDREEREFLYPAYGNVIRNAVRNILMEIKINNHIISLSYFWIFTQKYLYQYIKEITHPMSTSELLTISYITYINILIFQPRYSSVDEQVKKMYSDRLCMLD